MNFPGGAWLGGRLPERHILRRGLRFLGGLKRKWDKSFRRAKKRNQHMRESLSVKVYAKRFLRDFYASSREAGLRPFLMWGTLLGQVREGELLKHDRDIDIGIVSKDYAKKDALVAAMRKRGYELSVDKGYKFKFARPQHELLLDVDVFYDWHGMMVCASRQKDGTILGEAFSGNAFDRLREVPFLGKLKVLIPDPPEPVLKAIYGDWRTPVHISSYSSGRDPLNRLQIPLADPLAILVQQANASLAIERRSMATAEAAG